MPGAQTKKTTPGAYKSSLIPHQEQIFAWWFDERQTATEIQHRLQSEHNLEVHRTTITRFIKVRRLKPDPKQRPPHLQKTKLTAVSSPEPASPPKSKINAPTTSSSYAPSTQSKPPISSQIQQSA